LALRLPTCRFSRHSVRSAEFSRTTRCYHHWHIALMAQQTVADRDRCLAHLNEGLRYAIRRFAEIDRASSPREFSSRVLSTIDRQKNSDPKAAISYQI